MDMAATAAATHPPSTHDAFFIAHHYCLSPIVAPFCFCPVVLHGVKRELALFLVFYSQQQQQCRKTVVTCPGGGTHSKDDDDDEAAATINKCGVPTEKRSAPLYYTPLNCNNNNNNTTDKGAVKPCDPLHRHSHPMMVAGR